MKATRYNGIEDPVHQAARLLAAALEEDRREESDAANHHISHGRRTGPALYRLKKALREAETCES